MPTHFEDQPWYPKWKEAVERVVEAQMARDGTQPGTPEREAADRDYEAAFAAFRSIAGSGIPRWHQAESLGR
jgi:hypothetical protein